MVFDHTAEHPSQWAAIRSVAEELGCTTETLRAVGPTNILLLSVTLIACWIPPRRAARLSPLEALRTD